MWPLRVRDQKTNINVFFDCQFIFSIKYDTFEGLAMNEDE